MTFCNAYYRSYSATGTIHVLLGILPLIAFKNGNEATTPFCDSVYVDIENFDSFSATQMSDDTDLQITVANATRYAVSEVSSADGIGHDAFNVFFVDVSGDYDVVDGQLQQFLSIEQLLCVFDDDNFAELFLIINQKSDEISVALTNRMTALYPDEDEMEVLVALTLQLRSPLLLLLVLKRPKMQLPSVKRLVHLNMESPKRTPFI